MQSLTEGNDHVVWRRRDGERERVKMNFRFYAT
jgi:hypothetical protein